MEEKIEFKANRLRENGLEGERKVKVRKLGGVTLRGGKVEEYKALVGHLNGI